MKLIGSGRRFDQYEKIRSLFESGHSCNCVLFFVFDWYLWIGVFTYKPPNIFVCTCCVHYIDCSHDNICGSIETMKITEPCNACDGGKRQMINGDGKPMVCPYCKGKHVRERDIPDETHVMSEWRTEVRCPGDTPRFYGVRNCVNCGEEELQHPAGHFFGKLLKPCITSFIT